MTGDTRCRDRFYPRQAVVRVDADREFQRALSWLYHDAPDRYATKDDLREFLNAEVFRAKTRLLGEFRDQYQAT